MPEEMFLEIGIVSSPNGEVDKVVMGVDKNRKGKQKKCRAKSALVITH